MTLKEALHVDGQFTDAYKKALTFLNGGKVKGEQLTELHDIIGDLYVYQRILSNELLSKLYNERKEKK